MGNHLFVIFAVLDVSRAVNSCINHSFFTFIILAVSINPSVIIIVSKNVTIFVCLRAVLTRCLIIV